MNTRQETQRNGERRSAAATEVKSLKIGAILLLFAWPAAWYSVLIYGLNRLFVGSSQTTPTWALLLIIALGGAAEGLVALYLLRGEGRADLREQLRLRWPQGWKNWAVACGVLVLGMGLSMAAGPLNRALAGVPGFVPPTWWPAASNPTVQIESVGEAFPDVQLAGNFGFLALWFAIGLLCNVLGEELYYRGYLLPRMRGAFGRWAWVVNGVLFTLKHVYQRWLYPGILVGGLCFAFAAGPLGSLPLAALYHWVGNYLFQLIALLGAVLGVS